MASGASRSQNVAAWVQSIAIVLAGAWAAYEFIFKEQAKTLHINPSLEVTVLDPEHGEAGDVVPVEVEAIVSNSSDTEATVIAAFIAVWAHKAGPVEKDLLMLELTTLNSENNLVLDKMSWSQETKLVGYATAFSNSSFEPKERRGEKLVVYVPTGMHDSLEVKAEFYVVDSCRGFYPLETCYDFAARFTWDRNPICNVHDDGVDGNRWCYDIKARPHGGEEWQHLITKEARDAFGFVTFNTTQMTLLPNAPILQSGTAPK